jgi:kumamolisin
MPANDEALGPVDPNQQIEVSVVVRARQSLDALNARLDRPMSREEFAASYAANSTDLGTVADFASEHHLTVIESNSARRTVRLRGRAEDLARAFGVVLERYRGPDRREYRAPTGDVQLPRPLREVVQGVFGLDTRPVARRRVREHP